MKKTIFILVLSLFSFNVYGQIDKCSTDKMVMQELLINPNKKLILNQLETFTQDFISNIDNSRLLDTNYIIPVVVHVIHNYGLERIGTSQIESAIKSLCDDFNRLNDDLINSNGEFQHSISNNNDTVNVFLPDFDNTIDSINWLVQDGSSVQKNDTICSIVTNEVTLYILADDPGNIRFSGGIVNLLNVNSPNSGAMIAKIITTEARGFEDIVADVGVEFRLATKDPNGNCTRGVTYNQSTLTYNGGENVKDDTYWDNSKYLNIWTVESVASGAAAYAYYPGSAPTNHEGILCQHDYFGTTGTSSNSNWRRHTIAHEAGHYLNLAHPWGSTNDSALEENCGSDDGVDDTPNTVGASGCISWESQISCETLDNVANIMDYTNCAYMFSEGQKQRAIAALNATAGSRNNLWTQENLESTGVDDTHFLSTPYADCKPIPDFQVVGDAIGALGSGGEFSVSFEDMSYNVNQSEISYQWLFPGASPSTSTEQNPTVSYNISGQHDVTLIVSNNNGDSELVKKNCVIILDQTSAPFIEDFESLEFPINSSINAPNWYIFDNFPNEANWERSQEGSYQGLQSIRIRSKSFSDGLIVSQEIYSPEIDCSDMTHTTANPFGLYFNIAYAKRLPYNDEEGNSIIADQLIISRKHAGQQFMVRATLDVNDLVSTSGTYFNDYKPGENDWHEKFVNLGSSAGQESVLIKLEFKGKGYLSADTVIFTNTGGEYISNNVGGNWLYIDNLRLGNLQDTVTQNAISINSDTRIFDLFGREYNNKKSLPTGMYIQNKKLFFIKN